MLGFSVEEFAATLGIGYEILVRSKDTPWRL